jgi:hypothetical protein
LPNLAGLRQHTEKYRTFNEHDQFINLYEERYGQFQIGARWSIPPMARLYAVGLTRSGVDSRHAHMPVQKDIEQRQQRDYDTKTDTMTKTTSVRPSDISNMPHEQAGLTFVSRFFNLLLKSANSGEVIKIVFNLMTIILANSRSYSSVSIPIHFEMNSHHLSPRSLRLS